jgi:phosphoribosylformylglycinamidine synthase
MKAIVHVALKKTVLDPQGQTICRSLGSLGYAGIQDVRQGKFFEISLDAAADKEDARRQVEQIARDVLTNPVIEEFTYQLEEG